MLDGTRPAAPTSEWVRLAHADAWEVLGRMRAEAGGGTARLPGVRLMASGLPYPWWNSGDVSEPQLVDVAAVRAWYAARAVPWGLCVPAGAAWPHGRKALTKRLMGLVPSAFTPVDPPSDVSVRHAEAADVETVLRVDVAAFDVSPDVQRGWLVPLVTTTTYALAEWHGEPVAVGFGLYADGEAGPTGYLAGIGVLPDARRRGIGAAVSSWLVQHLLDAGAHLLHLHPDTDDAASIYRRIGFVEVDGLDVYVGMNGADVGTGR